MARCFGPFLFQLSGIYFYRPQAGDASTGSARGFVVLLAPMHSNRVYPDRSWVGAPALGRENLGLVDYILAASAC
jgi:hypothetical protein